MSMPPSEQDELRTQLTLHWWVTESTVDEYDRISRLLHAQKEAWALRHVTVRILKREGTQDSLLDKCVLAEDQPDETDAKDVDKRLFAFMFPDWDVMEAFQAKRDANGFARVPGSHPCWDRSFLATLLSPDEVLEEGLHTFIQMNAFIDPEGFTELDSLSYLDDHLNDEAWIQEKRLTRQVFKKEGEASSPVQGEAAAQIPFCLSLHFESISDGQEPEFSTLEIPMASVEESFVNVPVDEKTQDKIESFLSPTFLLHLLKHPDQHVGLATTNPELDANKSRLSQVVLSKREGDHFAPYAETDVRGTKELVLPEDVPSRTKAFTIRLLTTVLLVAATKAFMASENPSQAIQPLQNGNDTALAYVDPLPRRPFLEELPIAVAEAVNFLTPSRLAYFQRAMKDDNGLVATMARDPSLLTNIQIELQRFIDAYHRAKSEEEKESIRTAWHNHEGRKWLRALVQEEENLNKALSIEVDKRHPVPSASFKHMSGDVEPYMRKYVTHLSSLDAVESDLYTERNWNMGEWSRGSQRKEIRAVMDVFQDLRKTMDAKALLDFYGLHDPKAPHTVPHVNPRVRYDIDVFEKIRRAELKEEARRWKTKLEQENVDYMTNGLKLVGGLSALKSASKKAPAQDWYLTHDDTPALHKKKWLGTRFLDNLKWNKSALWEVEVPFQMTVTGIRLVHADEAKAPKTYVLKVTGYFKRVELYKNGGENGHFADTRKIIVHSAVLEGEGTRALEEGLEERKLNRNAIVIQGSQLSGKSRLF